MFNGSFVRILFYGCRLRKGWKVGGNVLEIELGVGYCVFQRAVKNNYDGQKFSSRPGGRRMNIMLR